MPVEEIKKFLSEDDMLITTKKTHLLTLSSRIML